MSDKPNILYIHSHDTGRYIQPYGYPVPTPRLQQFAEEGVVFRQAFCANPTCSASRASLLTGTWPHTNGMIGLAHRGSRLKDPSWHLASFLRAAGYETVLAGFQHEIEAARTLELGYERHVHGAGGAGLIANEGNALRAAEFIAGKHERPFFLACGFGLTHRTGHGMQWHNGARSPLGDGRYVRPPAPIPDLPETRQDFADWIVAARRLDACMGTVFEALAESGVDRDTLVIVTTDHGIAYPFMKCNLTDHGIGVMLMMRGPGGFAGGQVIDGLASHVDVFPTICEVAGLEKPARLQGASLRPLVTGAAASVREEVFAEVNYHAAYEPMRAVRTLRHKYIRRFEAQPGPVLPNCDDSLSKNVLLERGWAQRPQQAEALYDLVFDPHEACNLAGDPAHAAVLTDLRGRLDGWMRATDDPLRQGRVKPWPGMVVNDARGRSPQEPALPVSEGA